MRVMTNCCLQISFHKSLQLHLTVEWNLSSTSRSSQLLPRFSDCKLSFALLKQLIRTHKVTVYLRNTTWNTFVTIIKYREAFVPSNPIHTTQQTKLESWALTVCLTSTTNTRAPCQHVWSTAAPRMEPNKKLFIQINSLITARWAVLISFYKSVGKAYRRVSFLLFIEKRIEVCP